MTLRDGVLISASSSQSVNKYSNEKLLGKKIVAFSANHAKCNLLVTEMGM